MLHQYVTLLDRWRRITDLISDKAFDTVWTRHICDSLALRQIQPAAKTWLDIGSGAGFPSVVLAIALKGVHGAEIHCVEKDGRKCAFLRAVAANLDLPLKIHNLRAERLSELGIEDVEVITARAFSSVTTIVELAAPLLRNGAVAVLPRGKTFHSDIEQVDPSRYNLQITPSPNPEGGAIFRISESVRGP